MQPTQTTILLDSAIQAGYLSSGDKAKALGIFAGLDEQTQQKIEQEANKISQGGVSFTEAMIIKQALGSSTPTPQETINETENLEPVKKTDTKPSTKKVSPTQEQKSSLPTSTATTTKNTATTPKIPQTTISAPDMSMGMIQKHPLRNRDGIGLLLIILLGVIGYMRSKQRSFITKRYIHRIDTIFHHHEKNPSLCKKKLSEIEKKVSFLYNNHHIGKDELTQIYHHIELYKQQL